ncbi:MAG TPA: hypothetical protein VD978_34335 [Azospirillum sp.]|nr:hypothetical protein [Azospirillum sp.]
MTRSVTFRLLLPAAVLLGLGVVAADRITPAAFGGGSDAARASARGTAAHPAWGNPTWGYRFAFDGKCDDPRYVATTGQADPGADDYDCARYGGGLKK